MGTIARSGSIKSNKKLKQKLAFDAQAFLDSAGVARRVTEFKKAEVVYAQGNAAKSVMYLQSGGVKLTVVNEVGKEAVVGILGPGDFFGEGCLAGQPVRMGTATAITPSTVLLVEKKEMFKVLHEEPALSDRFIRFMLARNIRIEEDLVDQLLTPARSGSLVPFYCLPVTGKKTNPMESSPRCRKKRWRR
jgi:CRP/FNR family transcriptional regulator, cyclic AMP receptor protein